MTTEPVADLLRRLAPQVLGQIVRRDSGFGPCEDATQEALLAAAVQWPERGIPDSPAGWLITVATRRLTDMQRSEAARRQREATVATLAPSSEAIAPGPGDDETPHGDDTLLLLLLCCHPALSPSSQMALTLRAVGGLTTGQIARAFLVPEAAMGQRISRAKKTIKATGFADAPELDERLPVVLQVLYLIFNEGYSATSGPDLHNPGLTGEAIRLARELHRLLPAEGEVAGLLALMLLTEARRAARTASDGALIPLADQDRGRWDRDLLDAGTALLDRTLRRAPIGPYQLQAAIAAVHSEAASAGDTDWPQILMLYQLLENRWPTTVVRLNRAVALAMVQGPRAGLDLLSTLETDGRMSGNHRLLAVRAHLLERDGDLPSARADYEAAAQRTTSLPESRYLRSQVARLDEAVHHHT